MANCMRGRPFTRIVMCGRSQNDETLIKVEALRTTAIQTFPELSLLSALANGIS